MKAIVNFAVSLCALAGLLGSATTHATNISDLPLKASVLAKPNVIFGMDDSGSMDWLTTVSANLIRSKRMG